MDDINDLLRFKSGDTVLTFGELLLRFSPDDHGRWLNSKRIGFSIGGAEANVATALGRWGVSVAYLTALPDNMVSRQLANHLSSLSIDTSRIAYRGERIGLFYVPQGRDMKHEGVIYDRKYSSFSQLQAEDIDWEKAFEGIGCFHLTAISPALNPGVAALCLEGARIARAKGIKVTLDLNYRSQLWSQNSPFDTMAQIASCADLIMGNVWAVENLLDIRVSDAVHSAELITKPAGNLKALYLDEAEKCSNEIMRRFSNCTVVNLTYRLEVSKMVHSYYATLYTAGNGLLASHEYEVKGEIFKVGSGDCFMAGLLYSAFKGNNAVDTLDFAAAAAVMKLHEPGDSTACSTEAIVQFMNEAKCSNSKTKVHP